VFAGSLGAGSLPDWVGTKMFFSHFDVSVNIKLLREAGLAIKRMEDLRRLLCRWN
jgi:hypothetical protein